MTRGGPAPPRPPPEVGAALAALGKRRLVLGIHHGSFPGTPGEDTGRGTPYGRGGREFLRFARSLGFDGVQLGPQGLTTRGNPSPYDGTLFSRNVLDIDLHALVHDPAWAGLLDAATLAGFVAANPRPDGARVAHRHAHDAAHTALADAHRRLHERRARGDSHVRVLARELGEFARAQREWLAPDALYHALTAVHGADHYRHWPLAGEARHDAVLACPPPGAEAGCAARRASLEERHREAIERYALGQLVVHRQHAELRAHVAAWGLRLYGDLQVGLSPRDEWRLRGLYLPDYRLGAPPSRTNPEGQPWGYGVPDPDQYVDDTGGPGPVLRFLRARVRKLLDECDGLRVDHPHGLVCPWVYRAEDPDPHRAVRTGARLFESPAVPDHPTLARHAIARAEQLSPDPATPRHADDWVRDLDPEQVERYDTLLGAALEEVRSRGGDLEDDVVCEVLSTQPYPLARVMARHGLGRFRVTQKADLDDPRDVYRAENARPEDWVMVGNHDTPSIWRLAREWTDTDAARRRAAYLAPRLQPGPDAGPLAAALAIDRGALVHAMLADALASRARHVLVFFPDLLGIEEDYNRPGTVSEDNWTLRVAPDYEERYRHGVERGTALSLPRALALALRARGPEFARAHADLIARLD